MTQYKNILLIDDDDDDQLIFMTAVNQISGSANCIMIDSATEALQKLQDKSISPEIIFLDLNMPVMNGEELLKELKASKTLKDIPVIIFSTADDSNTKSLMKKLGATQFITKPDTYDRLVAILTDFISK